MKDKKHNENAFNIDVKLEIFKSVIEITDPAYKIYFDKPKTFRNILGFNSKVISKGYNISDNTIQATTATSILINCDLVEGSYHNGKQSNVLYSFPAYLVPVGYKINIIPPSMFYLSINKDEIHSITFEITNEEFEVLDFKSEEIAMAIIIRQV